MKNAAKLKTCPTAKKCLKGKSLQIDFNLRYKSNIYYYPMSDKAS